jgi:hypothetical protein
MTGKPPVPEIPGSPKPPPRALLEERKAEAAAAQAKAKSTVQNTEPADASSAADTLLSRGCQDESASADAVSSLGATPKQAIEVAIKRPPSDIPGPPKAKGKIGGTTSKAEPKATVRINEDPEVVRIPEQKLSDGSRLARQISADRRAGMNAGTETNQASKRAKTAAKEVVAKPIARMLQTTSKASGSAGPANAAAESRPSTASSAWTIDRKVDRVGRDMRNLSEVNWCRNMAGH